jgi:predicted nucleic acid-binding protein
MPDKVFVDSDVILDFALTRHPFFENSKTCVELLANKIAIGYTSAICIANAHYMLRKSRDDAGARDFLSKLLSFVTIFPVDHLMTLEALKSGFSDFEDALQYTAALRNGCTAIITRNTADYKKSKISVYTPEEFVRKYHAAYNESGRRIIGVRK